MTDSTTADPVPSPAAQAQVIPLYAVVRRPAPRPDAGPALVLPGPWHWFARRGVERSQQF